jgi:transcriptional regulator of acetoin/glycerol metabolism
VIATSSKSLFPLVERWEFCATLYYQLNQVYCDMQLGVCFDRSDNLSTAINQQQTSRLESVLCG